MPSNKGDVYINRACLFVRQSRLDAAVEQLALAMQHHVRPAELRDDKDLEPLQRYAPAKHFFVDPPVTAPPALGCPSSLSLSLSLRLVGTYPQSRSA